MSNKQKRVSITEKLLYSTIYNLGVLVDTLTVDMIPEVREAKIGRLKMSLTKDLQTVMKRMGIDGSDSKRVSGSDPAQTKKEEKVDGLQEQGRSLRKDSGEAVQAEGTPDADGEGSAGDKKVGRGKILLPDS